MWVQNHSLTRGNSLRFYKVMLLMYVDCCNFSFFLIMVLFQSKEKKDKNNVVLLAEKMYSASLHRNYIKLMLLHSKNISCLNTFLITRHPFYLFTVYLTGWVPLKYKVFFQGRTEPEGNILCMFQGWGKADYPEKKIHASKRRTCKHRPQVQTEDRTQYLLAVRH